MILRSIYLIGAVVLLMSLQCGCIGVRLRCARSSLALRRVRVGVSVCLLAGIVSVYPLDCDATVPVPASILQIKEDDYAAEIRMLEAEAQGDMSPLGSPGNSIAEDLIGLVFKTLGTYRGEGMDDLKGGNKGEGAFYTLPKEK